MTGVSISEAEARRRGVFRNIMYRAYPTGRDYSFTYELRGNAWRAYINNSPDYRGRPSGSGSAHWLPDGNRRYVCWTPEPATISVAQGISAMWADATENYIRTGRFEPPPGRPPVQDHSVLGDGALGRASTRGGAFRSPSSPSPLVPSHNPNAWFEVREHQLWVGGLAALFLCGLIWIGCMGNGFGFWDLLWMLGAGAGGVVAARQAERRPGGRGWVIALGVAVAALGLWEVGGGAPGIIWVVFWALIIACGIQFVRAVIRS